ncbi:hypothetical protein CAPTEDRAFT_208350 [Capitella teleta]|uniref:Uncharacterized protein n=1 Tax=Capitella teleta TaxID=283909 RepID=R7UT56_CAPTE|nr:hypothetical protein CAPTEDRAFT_208350 [Capitella teleta]|eukprot:ELU09694.1 hypothetical protein CAPTEDRAFT_208350 [Capitella teleta]
MDNQAIGDETLSSRFPIGKRTMSDPAQAKLPRPNAPQKAQHVQLLLCHLNPPSICNKTDILHDFIFDQKSDIFAITETWLSDHPTEEPVDPQDQRKAPLIDEEIERERIAKLERRIRDLTRTVDDLRKKQKEEKVEQKKQVKAVRQSLQQNFDSKFLQLEGPFLEHGTIDLPLLVVQLLNLAAEDIPVKSTVQKMALEMGVMSDIQVADFMHSHQCVTLGFDATTQDGIHVNAIHVTHGNECVVLSLKLPPGGTGSDYNRAVVNHAAMKKMNTVTELHSHMHPLDTIASWCKSILLAQEKALGLKSNLFGQACAAERIVLALNKLRFKDGFQSLPGRNEAPSRHHLSREPSSCAFPPVYTFVTYYDSFVTYLAQKCPVQNDLRVKLLEDMKTPHSKTELQALGIVGRLVFASWMSTINTNQPDFSYMEGVDLIISIIDRMKTLLASDVRFEKDMFENVLNKKDMPN